MASKFTVIEGGGRGPPDRHAAMARHHLQMLIIETLRSLARGDDPQDRVAGQLEQLFEHLTGTEVPLRSIVRDVVTDLNKKLDHGAERDIFEDKIEPIVLAALQVAAEALADDPAAKGRLSGRQQRLRAVIESQVRERKQRAADKASRDRYSKAMERLLHPKKRPKGDVETPPERTE